MSVRRESSPVRNMLSLLLVLVLGVGNVRCSSVRRLSPLHTNTDHFSYDLTSPLGPQHWGLVHPDCARGNQQSPVNICTRTRHWSKSDFNVNYMTWTTTRRFSEGEFENNGHSATFTVHNYGNTNDYGNILRGIPGEEGSDYVFYELHFHIGENGSSSGSEHFVNGRGHMGEIHMVHWKRNQQLRTFQEGAMAPNGLLAVGVFFDLVEDCDGGEANRLISQYVSRIPNVHRGLRDALVNPSLITPTSGVYYTYKGSKTTPPCNENVIWIVHDRPIAICRRNYEILMEMRTAEHNHPQLRYFGNDRPIQRWLH